MNIKENISVRKAINICHKYITIPTIVLFLGMIVFTIYIGFTIDDIAILWIIMPISIVCIIALPWLFWSLLITHWKLWAFENVRNVHFLYKTAVKEGILHGKNSFWDNTAISIKHQKEKWEILQNKFKIKDELNEDFNTPESIILTYKANNKTVFIFWGIISISIFIYLIVEIEIYIIGSILLLISLYSIYDKFWGKKESISKIIIISLQGIEFQKQLYSWDELKKVKIKSTSNDQYLVFKHPNGKEKIDLEEYSYSGDLKKLLLIYKEKYNLINKVD